MFPAVRATSRAVIVRRALIGAGAGILAVLIVLVSIGLAVEAGHLRGPVTRFIVASAGRPVTIDGSLEVRVLSLHPKVIAENVTIGNPPWMPPGRAAEIGQVTLVFTMPGLGRSLGIEKLEIHAATLRLERLASGHANWQSSPPGIPDNRSLPIVRGLSVSDTHVELDDALRHLQFRGTASAHGNGAPGAIQPLRIEGAGQLNGRSATFQIDSDPLATATHAAPYHFAFAVHSSGSNLTGNGFLSKPFDYTLLDTDFEASGADLRDLYFLTGVTLVNTGAYRLSGKLARRGRLSTFSELLMESGRSDVRGTLTMGSSQGRPTLDADLNSQLLRLADFGAHAAGRAVESGPQLLLSNASFKPATLRHGDGVINFHARRVEVASQSLQSVAATLNIDHGVLVVAPLTGNVLDGKFTAHIRIDSTTDDPVTDLDLTMKDLQLGLLGRKSSDKPPMQGLLRVRVAAKGHGTSIHQAAASANGTLSAVLPSGTIRASLAELTGIDLRGIGLMLAKNAQEAAVHCGVVSFRAHDGTLGAESLVIDTDPVLITGDGTIHLDTEALDLSLHGHPKSVRLLRLRSPLLIRGTLAHPSAGIQVRGSVGQAAEAVALGVLLTPLASLLALVDPGLAKDADCAALIAGARAVETSTAAPSPHGR